LFLYVFLINGLAGMVGVGSYEITIKM
jgi:hypothetical protein